MRLESSETLRLSQLYGLGGSARLWPKSAATVNDIETQGRLPSFLYCFLTVAIFASLDRPRVA